MPIVYPKNIRRKFAQIDLELLKQAILDDGFTFVREGGFKPEDKPFTFCNYLFYVNPITHASLRIGYDYPWCSKHDKVFEIMYWTPDCGITDITPDCRYNKWRKVMRNYN